MLDKRRRAGVLHLTLAAELDLADAAAARAALLAAVDGLKAGAAARLDLSAPAATAPALQLVAAARRSLEVRGAFAGYGPAAQARLGGGA